MCVLINKNDEVNNWSQEMHAITSHIEFKHIIGKENILADNLSRLRYLGLHDDNDPEYQEYGKYIFDIYENMTNSLDSDQSSNDKFEISRRLYLLDKNDLDNTHTSTASSSSLPHLCNLDPGKLN